MVAAAAAAATALATVTAALTFGATSELAPGSDGGGVGVCCTARALTTGLKGCIAPKVPSAAASVASAAGASGSFSAPGLPRESSPTVADASSCVEPGEWGVASSEMLAAQAASSGKPMGSAAASDLRAGEGGVG